MMLSKIFVAATLTLAMHVDVLAQAQWPVKPVRIVVPSSPGGGTDTIARLLAAHFSPAFGQQFVIDNRAGASGLIGYQIAARSAPDGYTLLLAPSSITSLPLVVKNTQYDVIRDFAPITQVVAATQVVVVHPSVPVKTIAELVALSKKTDQLTFASPGDGTVPRFSMELLKVITGMQITHIPYKGVNPGLADVVGGRVSAMLVNIISGKPHVDAGRLRALAVTSRARNDMMPGVPTVTEAGFGEYDERQWFGLMAPAGTPPAILSLLYKATIATLREPETRKRLADEEPVGNTPEEFSKAIRLEVLKWQKVARAAKIQPQ